MATKNANGLNASEGKIEDYYIIGPQIGKGAFSTVFEGTEKSTNEKFAIKVIKRKFIKRKLLEREIAIMTKIRHKNILFCKAVFETEPVIYLVLELVQGGELYDKIVEDGEYSEDEAKQIVLQLLDAVEYLHDNGIAHRDLKPENILCMTKTSPMDGFRREQIKVADFGLSKMFNLEDLISQCGSPTYIAPEVLLAKTYDKAVDMWAVGVVTYVILTGCFPFFEEANNYSALYEKIINVEYNFPSEPSLSEEAKSFIEALLVKDPKVRATPKDCRNSSWLKGVQKK